MPSLKEELLALQEQSQTGLKGELKALQKSQAEEPEMTRGEAARVGFFDRSVNAIASTPAALGELAAQGVAATGGGINAARDSIVNKISGVPADFIDNFLNRREELLNTQPLSGLQNLPRPPADLGENIRAFNQATSVDFENLFPDDAPSAADRFSQAQDDEALRTEQARELFPKMFGAGEVAADVGSVLTARAPLARARAPGQAAKRLAVIEDAKKTLAELPPGVNTKVNDVFTETVLPFFKDTSARAKSGVLKAGETGLEGALLAALNENDLESSFGLAAGAQGAGSLSLFLVEKPSKRLLPAVGLAWVASEMMKAAGPGSQDFFESKDFAIQKLVAVMGAGAVSAMAGAGRFRGPTAERFPAFMDSLTAVPRGAVVSLLSDLTKAQESGDPSVMQVMERFATSPSTFNENQQNALMRAMRSGKEGAFTREVQRLMDNEDFVRRLDRRSSDDPVERLRRFTPTNEIQRN